MAARPPRLNGALTRAAREILSRARQHKEAKGGSAMYRLTRASSPTARRGALCPSTLWFPSSLRESLSHFRRALLRSNEVNNNYDFKLQFMKFAALQTARRRLRINFVNLRTNRPRFRRLRAVLVLFTASWRTDRTIGPRSARIISASRRASAHREAIDPVG